MFEVLNDGFQHFLDRGDPRVKDFPMMKTPFPGFVMIAAYIYFVKVAGPQFMEKRKPFELRTQMIIYNFAMVFVNLIVFLGMGQCGWFTEFSLKCQPVDYSNAHEAVMMVYLGYLFYLTKFVEFADTIFFVLRKKYNQISALHVIHHSIVPFSLWFGIKFVPGGHHSLFAFINSLVHVIMYTYYGLAAFGDRFKKYLFWKKYMTYIQLAQFLVVIIHTVSLIVNKCESTYIFFTMNFLHAILFFGLFINFFVKTYSSRTQKLKTALSSTEKADLCSLNHKTHTTPKDENGLSKLMTNGNSRRRVNNPEDVQYVFQNNSEICKQSVIDDSVAATGNFCMMNGTKSSNNDAASIDSNENSKSD